MNLAVKTVKGWMILFLGLWLVIYLIYPSWALPISIRGRFFVYSLLLTYFAINGIFLYRWLNGRRDELIKVKRNFMWSEYKWFLVLCFLFIVLHIYPLSFSGFVYPGDASYHATTPLTLNEVASSITKNFMGISFLNLIRVFLLCLLVLFAFRRNIIRFFNSKMASIKNTTILWLALLFIFLAYFWFLRDIGFMQGVTRYPPIAKILYLFSYAVFGIHEFAPRTIQLLFGILTAFYIFRIARLYLDDETALYAAGFLLFLPNFFYWAGTAALGTGTVFFIAAASFYFLRSLRELSFSDRVMAAFLVGMGFLYYYMLLLMIPLFWMAIALSGKLRRGFYNLKETLKFSWICVIPILPWLIMTYLLANEYSMRTFRFMPSNWLQRAIALKYLSQMPSQIGYVFFLMFIGGLIYLLVNWKMNILNKYLISWIIVYYLFITSDWATAKYTYGVSRWSLYFYPAVALVIAEFFKEIIAGAALRRVLFCLLLVLSMLFSTVLAIPPIEDRYITYKNSTRNPDAAYDAALLYIKNHLPQDTPIFAPCGSNYFKFYIYKHNVQIKWSEEKEIDYDKMDARGIIEYCRSRQIDYVLEDRGNLDKDRFELIKDFTKGNNRLFLWRMVKR